MIHSKHYRAPEGSPDKKSLMTERSQELPDAINSILQYELGYGGEVIEVSFISITILTRIMSHVDTVIYTGDRDDMDQILLMLSHWVSQEPCQPEIITKLLDLSKGVPLILVALSGIVSGQVKLDKFIKRLQSISESE